MLALENAPTTEFLRHLGSQLPLPKAILVVSAHYETNHPMVTGGNKPETIHDFYGFPDALYALKYQPPGDPTLAITIQKMLTNAGFETGIDTTRGLDHGAWNPLLLSYPDARIPVVELSVQPNQDAHWHYKMGQALSPLHDDGILIIGSGNLTHNLREAFRGHYDTTPAWVTDFAEWVAHSVATKDIDLLLDWQARAPYALKNHPTAEHFYPFFVALGAAQLPLHAKRIHQDTALGVLAMDAYLFG